MQHGEWSPSTLGIAGCGLGGVFMAIATVVLVADGPGRVLTGVAAVGLMAFAALSWRARPKLAITEDGLLIGGWQGPQVLRRSDIAVIRITEYRRLARKARLLEIDTVDNRLVVLSRWDLGTDPLEVLDALTTAGYAGR